MCRAIGRPWDHWRDEWKLRRQGYDSITLDVIIAIL